MGDDVLAEAFRKSGAPTSVQLPAADFVLRTDNMPVVGFTEAK
jgi:hypothetical protein